MLELTNITIGTTSDIVGVTEGCFGKWMPMPYLGATSRALCGACISNHSKAGICSPALHRTRYPAEYVLHDPAPQFSVLRRAAAHNPYRRDRLNYRAGAYPILGARQLVARRSARCRKIRCLGIGIAGGFARSRPHERKTRPHDLAVEVALRKSGGRTSFNPNLR